MSGLNVIWVDQRYSGKNFAHTVEQVCGDGVRVEVIAHTFGWLNRLVDR